MKRMRCSARLLSALMTLVLLLGTFNMASVAAVAEPETVETTEAEQIKATQELLAALSGSSDYAAYMQEYATATKGKETVVGQATSAEYKHQTEQSRDGILLSSEQRTVEYGFSVPEAGVYNVELEYFAIPGKMKDVVFSLMIDGKFPFGEAEKISVSRVYKDASGIKRDQYGNDLRPSQAEVGRWNSERLCNKDGYYDSAYAFYFDKAGEHTVTVSYFEESMVIGALSLQPITELPSYAEYSKGAKAADSVLAVYEAEKSYEKSSSMLYPTYDRSGPAVSPSHYSRIRDNTIGQSNWAQQGQWISWQIEAPQDGWYEISLKARQNYQNGVNSYRTLSIDGEVPFAEVENISFPYDLNWYMKELKDKNGKPYLFHLTKGPHELRLSVAAGPMGMALKNLSDSVLQLNSIYRSIIMVTGTTPDKYRTYYLEEAVPDLLENMRSVRNQLDALYKTIEKINGTGGSQASVVYEMIVMLDQFLKKPLSISARVAAFKDKIESLGSLILTLSEQPLELDYITLSSKKELPSVKAGFWPSLSYGCKGFFASFVEDYNSVGSAAGNGKTNSKITVWISNGRDQAQILKNLIDNKFTPETGIGVSLSVVSTAAGTASSPLVQATLAGKGPDVALFTPKDTPINLAMRGALYDLSENKDFKEVYDRFYPSAWIPYEYCGGTYAVPETQNYDMLFYREDILAELGIAVPQTWDDFYTDIELLQKNHLEVGVLETNALNAGISSGISFFEKQLLQNGGSYYTEDLRKTAFDKTVAYEAFEAWTELYAKYGLDRSFDFFNRFRTGEMPIGIMSYVTYNQLYAAAPEIRGLWKMAPIPGVMQADGTIDRTETAAGTAAVILKDSKVKDAAWQFLKWWVSAETQSAYGVELEASLGVAARYDTANVQAFDDIGWNDAEKAVLCSQWQQVTDIPQIPGNYFIARCLTNAFRIVIDEEVNPVRALNIYNKDMNAEITRKRKEFGLK
ncbi:MAG: extracellular solute-binding protein [Clostridia bacterium]|nr:extracellular solute-binding protein [Clostridia bacterium]